MVCLRVAWECAVIDAASIATTSFVIDVWVNRFTSTSDAQSPSRSYLTALRHGAVRAKRSLSWIGNACSPALPYSFARAWHRRHGCVTPKGGS